MPQTAETHCASVLCPVSVAQALAFLADGLALGRWALGCWASVALGAGLVRGHSLFDGQPVWVRPVPDPARSAVVYHVGSAADALRARIWASAAPAAPGADAARPRCRIALHAQRTAEMDAARWLRLQRCHELEVLLICDLLSAQQPGPAPA